MRTPSARQLCAWVTAMTLAASVFLAPLSGAPDETPASAAPQAPDELETVLDSVLELKTAEPEIEIELLVEKLRAEFGRLRVQSDHALRHMKAAGEDAAVVREMTEKHSHLTRRAQDIHALIGVLQTLNRPPDEEMLGLPALDPVPADDVDRVAAWIDLVFTRVWELRGITPAAPADDDMFLRRASLDIVGRAPSWAQREAFHARDEPTRRGDLVDELVTRPEYGDRFADYWSVELIGRGYLPDDKHREPFVDWIREEFRKNITHDRFVTELVTCTGTTTKDVSPTAFLAARQSEAVANINKITNAFLGVQMQCAECHDDPYRKWTQADFHGMAAFLARQRENDKGGNVYELVDRDKGEQRYMTPDGRSERTGARYYDGTPIVDVKLGEDGEPLLDEKGEPIPDDVPRRRKLAERMVADVQLARAHVNRMWALLFGRGLVEPVENFTDDNPPTVPLVLDSLAAKFRESGFDNRWLLRVLCRTRAYGLSGGEATGRGVASSFARFPVKALTGEQMFDSILSVTDMRETLAAEKLAKAVVRGRRNKFETELELARDDFLNVYAWEPDKVIDPNEGTIPQTLALLNSRLVVRACNESKLTERAVERDGDELAASLYGAVLGRAPAEHEARRVVEFVATSAERRQAIADVVWTLINSAEFRYNH